MEKLTVYYSVQNGGDGSAYPIFFVDKDVAEWHQETENESGEGFAEDCTGEIAFEGDNLCCPTATTKEEFYLDLFLDGYENEDEVLKFVSQFFPDGLPKFDVKILDNEKYGVLFDGKILYTQYSYVQNEATPTTEEGRLDLEKKVNG